MNASVTTDHVSRSHATFAVAALFFANLVGYLDRQILTLLVNPVKQSLSLSDGEIGLMQGPAFVITFILAGLFVGHLLDRSNRRNLLLVCVAIWSVGAAAGGLAQNGWQLFLARMVVGIGEAALIPAGVSLISDLFDEQGRGKAYGFFTSGIYVGLGLSLILVALILPAVTSYSAALREGGVVLEPWRLVMLAMLAPGATSCLVLLRMREPSRSRSHNANGGGFDSGKAWLANSRFFIPHHLSLSCAMFGLYAVASWLPTVLIRNHGMEPSSVGFRLGVVVAIMGGVGATVGGALSDRFARTHAGQGRMRLAAMCALLGLAGFWLILISPNHEMAILGGGLATGGLCIVMVTGIMAMADLSTSTSRGFISAIFFVFSSLIGTAGGPALIGYLSDASVGTSITLGQILGGAGVIAAATSAGFAILAAGRATQDSAPSLVVG